MVLVTTPHPCDTEDRLPPRSRLGNGIFVQSDAGMVEEAVNRLTDSISFQARPRNHRQFPPENLNDRWRTRLSVPNCLWDPNPNFQTA